MKKTLNTTIKAITEGGIFTALYALLAIASRYLITGTDSIIYYFTPLILSIYVVRNKITHSISVLLASILLSFLFANPILTLMVIMPNIIVGFIFGCLEKHSKVKLINYCITFISCIGASILAIYAFELINGITYWASIEDLANNLSDYFNIQNIKFVTSVVNMSITIVIIIDSLIKSVLLYLVFAIIVTRLKLIENYTLKVKLPLKFKTLFAVIYILLCILLVSILQLYSNSMIKLFEIFIILLSTILFMYSFYLIYQFITFMRFKLKKMKNSTFIIIILLSILLFPAAIIIALILNLINYNILLDLL